MSAIRTYVDLGWGLLSQGLEEGGMHLIDAVFGAWILGMPLVIVWTLGLITVDAVRTRYEKKARRQQTDVRVVR